MHARLICELSRALFLLRRVLGARLPHLRAHHATATNADYDGFIIGVTRHFTYRWRDDAFEYAFLLRLQELVYRRRRHIRHA